MRIVKAAAAVLAAVTVSVCGGCTIWSSHTAPKLTVPEIPSPASSALPAEISSRFTGTWTTFDGADWRPDLNNLELTDDGTFMASGDEWAFAEDMYDMEWKQYDDDLIALSYKVTRSGAEQTGALLGVLKDGVLNLWADPKEYGYTDEQMQTIQQEVRGIQIIDADSQEITPGRLLKRE